MSKDKETDLQDNDAVHIRHCCIKHGCKYAKHDTCPVATGKKKQEYPCEYCAMEAGEI